MSDDGQEGPCSIEKFSLISKLSRSRNIVSVEEKKEFLFLFDRPAIE
jgi:hypothetical protein